FKHESAVLLRRPRAAPLVADPKTTTVFTAYAVATMAAIVATLAYVPVGALVAILAFGAFDVPLHSLLTFGGQIHIVAGLALWWGIAYLPALLYAAACMRT